MRYTWGMGYRSVSSFLLFAVLVFVLGVGGVVHAADEATPSAAQIAKRYTGGFTLVGAHNQAFDVIVRSDGTAHSTWVEGPGGSRGQAGRWEGYGNGILVAYDSGWRDWLHVSDSGAEGAGLIQQSTWKPGQGLLERPFAVARALPIAGARKAFVGVFSISLDPKEPDISITLQSSGRAFSNAKGAKALVPGTWWVEGNKARMIWADGWRNEFARTPAGWQHRSWRPESDFSKAPFRSGSLEAIAVLPD